MEDCPPSNVWQVWVDFYLNMYNILSPVHCWFFSLGWKMEDVLPSRNDAHFPRYLRTPPHAQCRLTSVRKKDKKDQKGEKTCNSDFLDRWETEFSLHCYYYQWAFLFAKLSLPSKYMVLIFSICDQINRIDWKGGSKMNQYNSFHCNVQFHFESHIPTKLN